MKNLVCASGLAIATMAQVSSLQAQSPQWLEHYGNGSNFNTGLLLTKDADATYLYGASNISGAVLDLDGHPVEVLGSSDILVAKWDTSGNVIWARKAGAACGPIDNEALRHIAYDPVGVRVVIGGYFSCVDTHFGSQLIHGHGDPDFPDLFVASYDTTGECVWVRRAYGSGTVTSRLLTDSDARTFMIGSSTGTTVFNGSVPVSTPGGGFIARFALDGTLESAARVLTNGSIRDAGWLGADEWVLTGSVTANAQLYGEDLPTPPGLFVARTDTLGSVQWSRTFRCSAAAQVWKCATAAEGRTYVTGTFADSLFIGEDTLIARPGVQYVFLMALSGSGDVEWATPIGSSSAVYAFDLRVGPEGDVYMLGNFKHELDLGDGDLTSAHSNDGFVARFDPEGPCIGATYFGRVWSSIGSVVPTVGSFYVSNDYDSTLVVGSQTWPLSGQDAHDLFLAKFPRLTGFTSIEELRSSTQEGLHIYANPNNGLCTIDLPAGIEHARDLVLSVYDQSGALVQRAPLTFTDEGLRLDIRAQAHGTYHVELVGGGERYTGSIVFE